MPFLPIACPPNHRDNRPRRGNGAKASAHHCRIGRPGLMSDLPRGRGDDEFWGNAQ